VIKTCKLKLFICEQFITPA